PLHSCSSFIYYFLRHTLDLLSFPTRRSSDLESVIRGKNVGVDVQLTGEATTALFSESQSRFLLTVNEKDVKVFESLGIGATKIGIVTDDETLSIKAEDGTTLVTEQVEILRTLWTECIAQLLKSK